MPVRRYDSSKRNGYGSFGQNVTSQQNFTKANLLTEAFNASLVQPAPNNVNDPIVFLYVQMGWRWKFSLLGFNPDKTQIYNQRTGRKKLGVVVTKHQGYVTSETFINYDDQMSLMYYLVGKIKIVGNSTENDDYIPCDEPPSDTPIAQVPDATWQASSWLPGIGIFAISASQNDVLLGDEATFYPDFGVSSYTFGGSYTYNHVTIVQSQLVLGLEPAIINL